MRWDAQALERGDSPAALSADSPAAPALLPLAGLVRSVSTPDFAGITFHEVTAKSVLNKVVAGSRMPFEWTINPYRLQPCLRLLLRPQEPYLFGLRRRPGL